MKILLNLTSSKVSFEYMDTTPFIQGTDSRNKILIYREQSATPALTNLAISYQVQSGRYTLPLGNTSATTETIDGVTYNKWTFSVPTTATALAGNIVACLVVKTASEQYKLNILNNVLESSQFDAFESGLTGAAQTYAQAMDDLSSANTVQDQRITALENATGTDTTQIGLLNQAVFGSDTGQQTADGLVSKVAAINTEIGTDSTSGTIKGRIKKNETDIASVETSITNINNAIGTDATPNTITGRITALEDADYQSQIDAINAGQNLADIVADLSALNSLSTTNLHSGDKVQVLVDSNHSNASTVYNWTGSSWSYIGKYGQDGYTKSQEDLLLAAKENKSNKITSWGTPTDTQYPSAKLVKDNVDSLENGKADKSNVYPKSEVYTKGQVDAIINELTVNGYAIGWEDLCDIFNEVYASDPLMTMLDSINGEVV